MTQRVPTFNQTAISPLPESGPTGNIAMNDKIHAVAASVSKSAKAGHDGSSKDHFSLRCR
jgi:hypothetical protein